MSGRHRKRGLKSTDKPAYVKPSHASQQRLLQTTCVYVMHNFPYFWLNKFGISDKPGARRKNVSETAPGYVFYLFAPNLLYGWECEGFVHTLYALQRVRFKGSGSSEWFMVFSPIVGTSFLIACHYLHISPSLKWYALAYFTPFVWLDGLLWLLIFFLGRVILFTGFLLFLCWAIVHVK